ncbi:MAG: hypothetical protein ACP5D7_12090 [Limnospira sp.]
MGRLSDRAFEILATEVKRLGHNDPAGDIGRQIVMRRLERARSQSGERFTRSEIASLLDDQFPNFNSKVLDRATRANRPAGLMSKVAWGGAVAAGFAGLIWVVNLPYPMIRMPVARTAPLLLLPSYISMDYNYRQAIALVEQVDQLVDRATAAEDLELGAEKAGRAQKHLDQLPVWFLGYYPKAYCTWMGCTWKFTLDEYESARKKIGRRSAQVFQEQNALGAFAAAEDTLKLAREQFDGATDAAGEETAIQAWQAAIDQLRGIPQETLAGKMARKTLDAAERDFEQEVGFVAGRLQGNTLIEAAQIFASQAANDAQNPPHTASHWKQVLQHWDEAIARLEQVPRDNPSYLEAQKKLAEYQSNRWAIRRRLEDEEASVKAIERSQKLIAEWRQLVNSENPNLSTLNRQLAEIIYTLESVKPGTTVNAQAQDLLQKARHTRSNL